MDTKVRFITVVIVALLLKRSSLFGQVSGTDYLVLNRGDTIYGQVQHVNYRGVSPRYYKKIRVTNANGKRKKYRREAVKSFSVNNTQYEGFRLSQSSEKITLLDPVYNIDAHRGEKHFLKVMSIGALSYYQLEWWEPGDSALWWMDLLKKSGDPFFVRATQGLFGLKRRVLSNYFADCPRLSEKIAQKELKEISDIVDLYRTNCID